MKILIILAAALLVPIMMKFQAQTILSQSNPKTTKRVGDVLKASNVADPSASMYYLEATISGLVATEAESSAIVDKIQKIRGVSSVDNLLVIQGWLKLARTKNQITVEGVVPSGWRGELLKGQADATTSGLQWRDSVRLAGKSAVAWGLFIDQFFQSEGNRALKLLSSQLSLSGETTPSEFEVLRKNSASLGDSIVLNNKMLLRPSRYHFESRTLKSPIEGEPLRALSQKLADSNLFFEPKSSTLSSDSRSAVNQLSALIVQFDRNITFVIGGHPDSFGEGLARQRAQKVRALLVENGVAARRLEIVPFDMTEDSGRFSGQVELLVH